MSSFDTLPAQALIPGAYERNTLTYRQPGSMGGSMFGTADVPTGPNTMSAATVADREMEGGGGASQRRQRRVDGRPQAARSPALEENASRSTGVKSWFLHWSRLVPR